MPIELISGPAGCGKTCAAIERVCKYDTLDWTSQVRYVVPTTQMARLVEDQLIERASISGILGNVACTFYGFAGEFIAKSGLSSRLISDIQKGLMLENLVRGADLDYLGKSSSYPGFIDALDSIIGELKISLIPPEDLQHALEFGKDHMHPASFKKISELTRLYARYQKDILEESNLHDREGLMWRALEIMQSDSSLSDLKCVVFDGFGELNGVQREFLSVIADVVPEVVVTLCCEHCRPEVFEPMESTRKFFAELGASEIALKSEECGSTSLSHLGKHIFAASVAQIEPDDSVQIIEGGNPSIEVELVAQEIRMFIMNTKYGFSDVAVAARDIESYRDRIERVFSDYKIPVDDSKHPLAETSIARLLVSIVSVVKNSWHRDDVIRVLKSEMLSGDFISASRVEVDSKQIGIIDGRNNWLRLWGDDDRDCDFRNAVLKCIADFEDNLQNAQSTQKRAQAVRELLEKFTWRTCDDASLAQDSAAHSAITQIIDDLLKACELIGRLSFAAASESG